MADEMNVFTYGSLMFPAVWRQVVRGDYRSSAASIQGFRRVCVRDGNYPALIIAPRAAPIMGRLYFAVSEEDMARLDYFETRNYERVLLAATVEGIATAAHAYLAADIDLLTDTDWNETTFEQSGLPVFLSTYAVKNTPPA
ncbi:MAG: gamma-glutamylcyclotransferase [Rhizobacter sp.]|nr:gamma-glutamylcyclotransferase [Burkholderiales bacterium]